MVWINHVKHVLLAIATKPFVSLVRLLQGQNPGKFIIVVLDGFLRRLIRLRTPVRWFARRTRFAAVPVRLAAPYRQWRSAQQHYAMWKTNAGSRVRHSRSPRSRFEIRLRTSDIRRQRVRLRRARSARHASIRRLRSEYLCAAPQSSRRRGTSTNGRDRARNVDRGEAPSEDDDDEPPSWHPFTDHSRRVPVTPSNEESSEDRAIRDYIFSIARCVPEWPPAPQQFTVAMMQHNPTSNELAPAPGSPSASPEQRRRSRSPTAPAAETPAPSAAPESTPSLASWDSGTTTPAVPVDADGLATPVFTPTLSSAAGAVQPAAAGRQFVAFSESSATEEMRLSNFFDNLPDNRYHMTSTSSAPRYYKCTFSLLSPVLPLYVMPKRARPDEPSAAETRLVFTLHRTESEPLLATLVVSLMSEQHQPLHDSLRHHRLDSHACRLVPQAAQVIGIRLAFEVLHKGSPCYVRIEIDGRRSADSAVQSPPLLAGTSSKAPQRAMGMLNVPSLSRPGLPPGSMMSYPPGSADMMGAGVMGGLQPPYATAGFAAVHQQQQAFLQQAQHSFQLQPGGSASFGMPTTPGGGVFAGAASAIVPQAMSLMAMQAYGSSGPLAFPGSLDVDMELNSRKRGRMDDLIVPRASDRLEILFPHALTTKPLQDVEAFLAVQQHDQLPRPEVYEFMENFFANAAPGQGSGGTQLTVDRAAVHLFDLYFGGRGIIHCFQMIYELYSLPFFHRFLPEQEVLPLLRKNSQSTLSGAQVLFEGQFLLRFNKDRLREGWLAFHGLPAGETREFTASARYMAERRCYVVRNTQGHEEACAALVNLPSVLNNMSRAQRFVRPVEFTGTAVSKDVESLFIDRETQLSFETVFAFLEAAQDDSVPPSQRTDVQDYLVDFFCGVKRVKKHPSVTVDRETFKVFQNMFGAKGPHKFFAMVVEIYGNSFFHRFMSRSVSYTRLNLECHRHPDGERGQALLRFSETELRNGNLTLDALRIGESDPYSALVSYHSELQAWIIGTDTEIRFAELDNIFTDPRTRPSIPNPIPFGHVNRPDLQYGPGFFVIPHLPEGVTANEIRLAVLKAFDHNVPAETISIMPDDNGVPQAMFSCPGLDARFEGGLVHHIQLRDVTVDLKYTGLYVDKAPSSGRYRNSQLSDVTSMEVAPAAPAVSSTARQFRIDDLVDNLGPSRLLCVTGPQEYGCYRFSVTLTGPPDVPFSQLAKQLEIQADNFLLYSIDRRWHLCLQTRCISPRQTIRVTSGSLRDTSIEQLSSTPLQIRLNLAVLIFDADRPIRLQVSLVNDLKRDVETGLSEAYSNRVSEPFLVLTEAMVADKFGTLALTERRPSMGTSSSGSPMQMSMPASPAQFQLAPPPSSVSGAQFLQPPTFQAPSQSTMSWQPITAGDVPRGLDGKAENPTPPQRSYHTTFARQQIPAVSVRSGAPVASGSNMRPPTGSQPLPPRPAYPAGKIVGDDKFLALWSTAQTLLSLEIVLDFIAFQQESGPATPSREDVKEYIYNFFRHVNAGRHANDLVNRDSAELFKKFFFGKGLAKAFQMVTEVYSLRYFHRFLNRDGSLQILMNQCQTQGQRGQFLLRFSTSNMRDGCLALDALRTDEQNTYTALVRYSPPAGGWIIGDGKDAQGKPKVYTKLKHIYEANKNVLVFPVPVEKNPLFYQSGWHAFPPKSAQTVQPTSPATRRCPYDGNVLSPDERWCTACGNPVPLSTDVPAPAPTTPATPSTVPLRLRVAAEFAKLNADALHANLAAVAGAPKEAVKLLSVSPSSAAGVAPTVLIEFCTCSVSGGFEAFSLADKLISVLSSNPLALGVGQVVNLERAPDGSFRSSAEAEPRSPGQQQPIGSIENEFPTGTLYAALRVEGDDSGRYTSREFITALLKRLAVGPERLRIYASRPGVTLLMAIVPSVSGPATVDIAQRLIECIELKEFGLNARIALATTRIEIDQLDSIQFHSKSFEPLLASIKLQQAQARSLGPPQTPPAVSTPGEPAKCIVLERQPEKYHRISPEQGGSTKTFDITLIIKSNDAYERAEGEQNRKWLASATLCYWDTKEEIPDALDGMTSAPFIDGKARLKQLKIRHDAYVKMARQSHQVFLKFWIHYNARLGESIPLNYPADFWRQPIESEPFIVGTYTKAKFHQKERAAGMTSSTTTPQSVPAPMDLATMAAASVRSENEAEAVSALSLLSSAGGDPLGTS